MVVSQQHFSRRDVLKTATAVAAPSSFAGMAAAAEKARATPNGALHRIDQVLHHAAESKAVPGIVAIAATDHGILYEGAFRRARYGERPADHARHGLLDRLDDEGGDGNRVHAAPRAREAPDRA